MAELTKERLQEIAEDGFLKHGEAKAMARQLLAGMEQEPVADVVAWHHPTEERNCDIRLRRHDLAPGPLYAAPQLSQPAVVPEVTADDCPAFIKYDVTDVAEAWARGYNARSAAMLQGAEPVSQHPALTVWYGSMPETNGKSNWTAILHRKGEGIQDGITIDRSEYPGRVLYAADRVRYLIGEKPDRPYILDYDGDKHSGYVKPVSQSDELPMDYQQGHKDGLEWAARLAEANHPQTGDWLYDDPLELAKAIRKGPDMPIEPVQGDTLRDGWVAVPVEPTPEMNKAGWAAMNEHDAIDPTYRAMLAAAPDFREISNSSTKHFRENTEASTKCWCHTCRPVTMNDARFVVCPHCGNKRCPHANDHRNACTGSNEPGQEGSAYPAAPQQEVK